MRSSCIRAKRELSSKVPTPATNANYAPSTPTHWWAHVVGGQSAQQLGGSPPLSVWRTRSWPEPYGVPNDACRNRSNSYAGASQAPPCFRPSVTQLHVHLRCEQVRRKMADELGFELFTPKVVFKADAKRFQEPYTLKLRAGQDYIFTLHTSATPSYSHPLSIGFGHSVLNEVVYQHDLPSDLWSSGAPTRTPSASRREQVMPFKVDVPLSCPNVVLGRKRRLYLWIQFVTEEHASVVVPVQVKIYAAQDRDKSATGRPLLRAKYLFSKTTTSKAKPIRSAVPFVPPPGSPAEMFGIQRTSSKTIVWEKTGCEFVGDFKISNATSTQY